MGKEERERKREREREREGGGGETDLQKTEADRGMTTSSLF